MALHFKKCGGFNELRRAACAAPVHAVQHQAMQMNVEVGRRAKTLDQRDRAAVGFVGLEPSLAEQVPRDHAVHHLQYPRHQAWAVRPAAAVAGSAVS